MCPLPLATPTGFGQPMVAGPVFLPPCFPIPVPIQGSSLPGGSNSFRFHSTPLSLISPPSHHVEFQDAGGRLLLTEQGQPSLIPEDSRRSSRTGLQGPGLPVARQGDEFRSPTPSKRSRLELPHQEKVAPLPQPAGGSSEQVSASKMRSENSRIVPSASVQDYNVVCDSRPGNIYNMRVRFWLSAFFL